MMPLAFVSRPATNRLSGRHRWNFGDDHRYAMHGFESAHVARSYVLVMYRVVVTAAAPTSHCCVIRRRSQTPPPPVV